MLDGGAFLNLCMRDVVVSSEAHQFSTMCVEGNANAHACSSSIRALVSVVQERLTIILHILNIDPSQLRPTHSFITAKGEYDIADVNLLAETIVAILDSSGVDSFAQLRWASTLGDILRQYRYKLELVIDWRMVYRLLCNLHLDSSRRPEGSTLTSVHSVVMTRLARRARRFYSIGTSTDVWDEFRPRLFNTSSNTALEALGFLCLFMPVHGVGHDGGRWNEWISEWIEIWNWVPHCRWWNAMWLDLFSRLAKHDIDHVIQWGNTSQIDQVITKVHRGFEIPIGSSQGSAPIWRSIPSEVQYLFKIKGGNASSGSARFAAKLLVYLLGCKPESGVTEGIRRINTFLENYFHPSNGGSWSGSLASYLRYMGTYLQKKLSRDRLPDATVDTIVHSVARLASRAQFSKTSSLSNAGISTMSILAQINTCAIAPLIVERFHEALESDTAMHQLSAAITALSRAARPIMQAAEECQQSAADASAEFPEWCNIFRDALVVTLPGIDANDPSKTLAVLELYASVVSNCRALDDSFGDSVVRPAIGWQQWSEEFFDRIFCLLTNLNSPGSGASGLDDSHSGLDDACTFLFDSKSFFSPLIGLVISRMPKLMLSRTVKRISQFLLTNSMLGVLPEMGVLGNACAMLDPGTTSSELIAPLCKTLRETLERAVPGGKGARNISKTLEDTLEYQLALLRHGMYSRSGVHDIAIDFLPDVIEILQLCLKSTSLNVVAASGQFLEALLLHLVHQRPVNSYAPSLPLPIRSDACTVLDVWLTSREMEETQSVEWRVPGEEHYRAAKRIVDEFLVPNLEALATWERGSGSPSDESKRQMRAMLWAIDGCLAATTVDCDPRTLMVSCASSREVIDGRTRTRMAEVLRSFVSEIDPDDNETMHAYIRLVSNLLLASTPWYDEFVSRKNELQSDARVLSQRVKGSFSARRPMWLHVERARSMHLYRMSQMHYKRPMNGAVHGEPPSQPVVDLIQVMFTLSLHPYSRVRSSARNWMEQCNKAYPTIVPGILDSCKAILINQAAPSEPRPVGEISSMERAAIEGAVCGAATMLYGRSLTRYMMRHGEVFSSVILVLCDLYRLDFLDSVHIQASLQNVFIMICSRFSTAGFRNPNAEDLVEKLLNLWEHKGSLMHWRVVVFLNSVMILMVHEAGAKLRSRLLGHFLNMFKNPSPAIRPLALTAVSLLLRRNTSVDEDALRPLKAELSSSPDRWVDILDSIAYSHIDRSSVEGGSGGLDQSIVRFLLAMFSVAREWPKSVVGLGRASYAISSGEFVLLYARTIKRLIRWAGPGAVVQVRPKLEEMVKSREHPAQCAAAEIFGGLVRSGMVTVGSSGRADDQWSEWIGKTIRQAVRDSPVNCIGAWCASLRYCVKGSDTLLDGARGALIEVLFEPVTESESSNLQMRRLQYFTDCLAELTDSEAGDGAESFKCRLVKALEALNAHAARQVREQAGKCAAQMGCLYNHPVLSSSALMVDHDPCALQVESLITGFTTQARHALGVVLGDRDAIDRPVGSDGSEDSMKVDDGESVENVGGGGVDDGTTWDKDRSTACLETILYFVMHSVRNGDSMRLSLTIKSLLPIIVRIQETPNDDFSMLAKTALAFLKWHTIPVCDLPGVIDGLMDASRETSSWHTRAAALSFLQVLWYRHFFLLPKDPSASTENGGSAAGRSDAESMQPREQGLPVFAPGARSQILNSILVMMTDEQLEVRELAASTLAGLFKGMDDGLANSLRSQFMDEATRVFDESRQYRKRKRMLSRAAANPSSVPATSDQKSYEAKLLTQTHAAALALSACIQSSPYDMPSWLPSCLCLFTEFSTEPSPVGDSVSRTLSDFWRTHTDNWHKERTCFSTEELDILTSSRNAPSYYT